MVFLISSGVNCSVGFPVASWNAPAVTCGWHRRPAFVHVPGDTGVVHHIFADPGDQAAKAQADHVQFSGEQAGKAGLMIGDRSEHDLVQPGLVFLP